MDRTLYIIDGYAQFFRNYHAIRTPMTSPVTKEPTNMTFGFVGMLLKLLKGEGAGLRAAPATHLAVVLDVSGDRGTFRSRLYPEYKATRKPPPEDLAPQVQRCLAMLKEIGVPVLGAEGYEADDVMAGLVTRLREREPSLRVRMVSKDKDLKQLLHGAHAGRAPVELFDVHTDTVFTEATLREQTGLSPSQVVDMLALMGDSVDNVPGVEGVGEKTAATLIAKHGTLEALLSRAKEVPGKRGEALRAAGDLLALSKKLVTLDAHAPAEMDLADADVRRLRLEKLIPICKELGFNRYQDEVRSLLGGGASPASGGGVAQREGGLFGGGGSAAPPLHSATQASAPRKPAPAMTGGLFDEVEAARGEVILPQAGSYRAVLTRSELLALRDELSKAPVIAIDTETTSLSPRDARLCGISVSVRAGTGVYVPLLSPTPERHLQAGEVLEVLGPILEDAGRPKCGHNLKYDLLVLRAHGITLRGVAEAGGFDSMVASYLIDASRSSHGLDALAMALLGRTNISISQLIGSGKDQRCFSTVGIEQATQYAAEDADVALQLRERMLPALQEMGLVSLFERVEMPLVKVLADLEWNGVLVDGRELDRQRERLQRQIDDLRGAIDHEARTKLGRTFEPDSPKQLAAALFGKPDDDPSGLGLKVLKRTKTGASTDAEVLEALAEDEAVATNLPRLILEYRQLTKLVSTYLVALKDAIHPKTGRVHASFHQTVAETGRLSSSDPNLQNIPIRTDVGREIRRAFVAPAGRVLVTADYSQIELRLLAHLSKDPGLIEAFRAGEDIHTAVAAQVAGKDPRDVTREERSGAKMVNFGIVYGITPFGLARRLKIDTREAERIIDGYKRRFAGITTFLQECIEQARSKGYVTTMLGRRRPIPDIESTNPSRRALAERLAINSVVQGSAADLIKAAMVRLDAKLARDAGLRDVLMILQVHDELVLECDEAHAQAAAALMSREMEQALDEPLLVPLKADTRIARTWFDGK